MSEPYRSERLTGGIRQIPFQFFGFKPFVSDSSEPRNPSARAGVADGAPALTGSVSVVSRDELPRDQEWAKAFSGQRKDHRYYEIVEETICPDFQYRYFVVRDAGGDVRSIQPFFILDQDLLAGTRLATRWLAARVRKLWPRFMTARTLMVGCAAGEGHLDGRDDATRRFCAEHLVSAIVKQAQVEKARLIVLKEFPARYREILDCFRQQRFVRVPSLPMTSLNINYASFGEYMTRVLSRATRKDLRRKFKTAARAEKIELSVIDDVTSIIDELYPLYVQVYDRSHLHFEKLTREYICELGRRMPEKTRFFVWRQGGRIVAFNICMLEDDSIYDEYIGLDYAVALDIHLYHYTFRDIVTWAIANGYKWYRCNGLNYDPKLHLKCRLEPIDLYVRHTSTVFNAIMTLILPLIEPTRYDKNLKRFANYDELWGRS
jgi:Acetyltransferase (GNAT) domain